MAITGLTGPPPVPVHAFTAGCRRNTGECLPLLHGVECLMRRRPPSALALLALLLPWLWPGTPGGAEAPADLARHLAAIAMLARPSPAAGVPAGWFVMGTIRK